MKAKEIQYTGRLNWVDAAKGIGILLVLLGHAPRDIMRTQYPFIDFLYYFIYSFHMPLFFFLAGIIFGHLQIITPSISFFTFLKKKVKTLLVPWVSFSILIYLVIEGMNYIPTMSKMLQGTFMEELDFGSYIMLCIKGENPYCIHLWYIYSLFFVQIFVLLIFRIYQKVTKKKVVSFREIRILVGIAIVIFLFMPSQLPVITNVKSYLMYYALGIYYAFAMMKIKTKFSLWMIGGILCCSANSLVVNMNGFNFHTVRIGIYYITVFVGVPMMIALICSFAKKLEKNKWLLWLGRNSFDIYLLHQPFCCATLGIILLMIFPHQLSFYLLIMGICTIASVVFPFAIMEIAWRLHIDSLLKSLFGVKRMKGDSMAKKYNG